MWLHQFPEKHQRSTLDEFRLSKQLKLGRLLNWMLLHVLSARATKLNNRINWKLLLCFVVSIGRAGHSSKQRKAPICLYSGDSVN